MEKKSEFALNDTKSKTSKQIVQDTLSGKNCGRTAQQMWYLPWAQNHYPEMIKKINADFPDDIVDIPVQYSEKCKTVKGNAYEKGEYIDEWGCIFTNVHAGIIGEVKKPIVTDDDWTDCGNIHIPEELLSFEIASVNKTIKDNFSDKFVKAGACPRPFEQLQFIRGTENLYMDLMYRPSKMMSFIEKMHDFYCRLLRKWAKTDVDALMFMDDWGSQNSLLINPSLWREIFEPMYKDYIDIAHSTGKKIFMHSDGNTLSIIPYLIDLGLDAMNAQIFCIGLDNLKQYKGKLTFWGEIDRQDILVNATEKEVFQAVKKVYDTLYDGGFCIAQCEFGPGAKPENIYKVFSAWQQLTSQKM